ncbi:hypothetical protein [Rickettsia felis]|uniref:hypothetical protein n=1 Tax=Rickettsia felis TaxID=42862 RepID=UPI0009D7107A
MVKDFLLHPRELLLKETFVKITISLSKDSVEFFKSEAATAHVLLVKLGSFFANLICSDLLF